MCIAASRTPSLASQRVLVGSRWVDDAVTHGAADIRYYDSEDIDRMSRWRNEEVKVRTGFSAFVCLVGKGGVMFLILMIVGGQVIKVSSWGDRDFA